jgi:uncharacterized protein YjiS (DUF1127 family)
LHREQCFTCTEICIGSFCLRQPDCTGNCQSSAVDEHAVALDKRLRQRRRIARSNDWRPEMSATLSTIIRPAVTKRPGAFSRLFSACLDRTARYFVRRAAIACLRELDDRALRDIGLVRSQIEAAVHGFMTAPDRARV